ncbi:hypothetical protein DBIPINDM_007572 (plasmid) [Mesorhizobium sp. AR02]|uniref:hypothetical protein n=1 Tax=Mesorhizobium sp. AR02 TaxID=2865837 RepID=UPI00215DF47B|nr:hypothetical protein [Mesorhizobium sp. AR02]UVK50258.1 hypothetical protein DBIPINDM_007572 [Mesorhizobium sp. AR02]
MLRNHRDNVGADASDRDDVTLWDLADPDEAVKAALEVYGPSAASAAADCALTAHFDGRDRDYRFWSAVFSKLNDGKSPGTQLAS